MRKLNLIGERYGRLTVIESAQNKGRYTCWKCRCDCGKEVVVRTLELRQGDTKSCGCIFKETQIKTVTKHGGKGTRLYRIWKNIKTRCNNPNVSCAKYYSKKGITMDEKWENDFAKFREWAESNGYDDKLTIDRIDTNGNYTPDNCRWVSQKEQANNMSSNRIITFNGETHTLAEWCRKLKMPYGVVNNRLNAYGWDISKALTTPVRGRK